jgi:hypothetical protein
MLEDEFSRLNQDLDDLRTKLTEKERDLIRVNI